MKVFLPTALLLACCAAQGQARPVVVLDPARGGTETGARFSNGSAEKQVTLDLATRLRFLLNARGMDVVLTRDSDVTVTNDQRAATANGARPIACVLLHATAAGSGVHLYSSALKQASSGSGPASWNEAQAAYIGQSLRLTNEVTAALTRSRLPVSAGLTWMHPLDNVQCPAVALELGPKKNGTPPTNADYQTEVAEVLAGALLAWRNQVVPTATGSAQP